MAISFNRPTFVGKESEYMQQALQNDHISGDGPFTKKVHTLLEEALGVPKVLLTTSCTHALEMSALLLDLQDGDEVIVPSFTFVSSINAFVLRGAKPVFADVRPDTLNLDESRLEALITPKTCAIVVVHYAGVACDMDTIMDIANRHNIPVIEDNAHGLFGKYKGKYLGTFGVMATQSFHETKNFTSGEGGALIINDPKYIDDAEILREKGTNRSRFFRGQVDKYTWVNVGSSYLPSDMLAAFLLAQLEEREQIQSRRQKIWETYYRELGAWAEENNVQLPFVPSHCEQTYHMFYVLFPNLEKRQAAIAHLKARGIQAVFHYLPLHLSPMGEKYGGKPGDCEVTEQVSDQLLRLPFYTNMTDEEQKQVVEALKGFSV
ncbi:MAG: dTDP-4-amino-4,6-dideoxygalactose transaminase [Chloroflexota bacterium]